jgi:hypothetical protein
VKRHDWQRQGPRFRCERCAGIVSATTGTAYAGIRTDLTTYLRGATALAEGLSIRATGRLLGVDKDTTNHWLPVLGQHCQGVMNYFFRNLHLHECQLDELWTFIHKKEGQLTSLEKLAEVYGINGVSFSQTTQEHRTLKTNGVRFRACSRQTIPPRWSG